MVCYRASFTLFMDFFLVLMCGTRVQNLLAPFSYTLYTSVSEFYLVYLSIKAMASAPGDPDLLEEGLKWLIESCQYFSQYVSLRLILT
jgi:hypothetical protein